MKTMINKINIRSKEPISLLFIICSLFFSVACSDMFETDSDRQIFNPDLDQKTDSMFYTLGILKGLQQAADQYVMTGEMRGDLVATNVYTETDLRDLADFSLTPHLSPLTPHPSPPTNTTSPISTTASSTTATISSPTATQLSSPVAAR